MSTSMLGNDVKLKNKEREEIEAAMKKFFKSKQKITVCPPLPRPTIPEPSKVTIKAEIKGRRKKKTDTRKRVRLLGIEYNEKKRAMIDGVKFGKLMPMFVHEKRANDRQYIWACLCDCGKMVDVRTSLLTRGIISTCPDCVPVDANADQNNERYANG